MTHQLQLQFLEAELLLHVLLNVVLQLSLTMLITPRMSQPASQVTVHVTVQCSIPHCCTAHVHTHHYSAAKAKHSACQSGMHPSILVLHPETLAALCHMLGYTQLMCSCLASLLVDANLC
jgi:protein-S-isoprenylcysteine O-methyltransferase Ste14